MKRALAMLLAACIPGPIDLTGKTCGSDEDCGPLKCIGGVCGGPMAPVDSGTPDSGSPDSGTPDAGTHDAGTPDAGTTDAGPACPPPLPYTNLDADPGLDPLPDGGWPGTFWNLVIVLGGQATRSIVDGGTCHETAAQMERISANMNAQYNLVLQPAHFASPGGSYYCARAWVRAPEAVALQTSVTLNFYDSVADHGVNYAFPVAISDVWTELRYGHAPPTATYDSIYASVNSMNPPGTPLQIDDVALWVSLDGGCE